MISSDWPDFVHQQHSILSVCDIVRTPRKMYHVPAVKFIYIYNLKVVKKSGFDGLWFISQHL